MSASSWLDDYFSWIEPNRENSCCRIKYKRNETCFRTTVMPPNSTNTTTPAPAVICYNETTPVVPYVFCNATGECLLSIKGWVGLHVSDVACKAEVNLFHSPFSSSQEKLFIPLTVPLSPPTSFSGMPTTPSPFPLPPSPFPPTTPSPLPLPLPCHLNF